MYTQRGEVLTQDCCTLQAALYMRHMCLKGPRVSISNGMCPVSMSYKTQPADHMSAAAPLTFGDERRIWCVS